MKIKKVRLNSRMKAFEVQTANAVYQYPLSRLRVVPSAKVPMTTVFVDIELGREGFTYRLANGAEDSVLMDQVLEYARDPDYLRKALLSKMALYAEREIEKLSLPKREIIRRMRVTPTQFYRLMNRANTHKTIDQMLRLLAALDCEVDFVIKKAA